MAVPKAAGLDYHRPSLSYQCWDYKPGEKSPSQCGCTDAKAMCKEREWGPRRCLTFISHGNATSAAPSIVWPSCRGAKAPRHPSCLGGMCISGGAQSHSCHGWDRRRGSTDDSVLSVQPAPADAIVPSLNHQRFYFNTRSWTYLQHCWVRKARVRSLSGLLPASSTCNGYRFSRRDGPGGFGCVWWLIYKNKTNKKTVVLTAYPPQNIKVNGTRNGRLRAAGGQQAVLWLCAARGTARERREARLPPAGEGSRAVRLPQLFHRQRPLLRVRGAGNCRPSGTAEQPQGAPFSCKHRCRQHRATPGCLLQSLVQKATKEELMHPEWKKKSCASSPGVPGMAGGLTVAPGVTSGWSGLEAQPSYSEGSVGHDRALLLEFEGSVLQKAFLVSFCLLEPQAFSLCNMSQDNFWLPLCAHLRVLRFCLKAPDEKLALSYRALPVLAEPALWMLCLNRDWARL